MKRLAYLSWWVVLVACGDDPPFLALSRLCDTLAEDVCDVRVDGCCTNVDLNACREAFVTSCKQQVDALDAEANLYTYDSVEAAKIRNARRAELDRCGNVPSVVSYFEGGLADGTACERDAQCTGGRCDATTRVCAALAPAPICGAP